MIPAIDQTMLSIGQMTLAAGGSLAASTVAKVTVIAALALLAVRLARRSRAAVRHAFLAAAFGVTLLLPIASVVVPPVHVGVPVGIDHRAGAGTLLASGVEQDPPVLMKDDAPSGAISLPDAPRISLSRVVLAGWIAGSAIFLVPLAIGLWQIRRLRGAGLPWRRGQALADEIALDAGVRRPVEVLLHEGLPGPMTCGMVHPVIVLPRDAESWHEDDLNRAIVHEMEHVRRGDSVSGCLARAACAMYWFHPLVWMAWRRLVLEAERSCDDAVLRHSEATAYAAQLVGLAERLSMTRRAPLVAMADRSDLAARVRALLDSRQRRGRAGAFWLGLATTAAMVLVMAMSSLMLVARPQTAPAQVVTPRHFNPVQVEHEESAPVRLVAQAASPAQPAAAAPAKLEFEVASIRRVEIPATANGRVPVFPTTDGIGTSDPHRITYRGTWLTGLIADAFGVRSDQITGLGAVSSERYDIVAKIPDGATKEQFNAMLGNLLRDRFHLRFHMESKMLPAYALRVAKNGPRFKATARSADDATVPPRGVGAADAEGCPILPPNYQGMVGRPSPGEMCWTGQDVPLANLARLIEQPAGRPVVDETGLTGNYDFKIHFEWVLRGGDAGDTPGSAPSIFTAVEEQLGLKLESASHSFPQLVIDSIDRDPTEN